jgi:hypothetical protein
LLLAGAAFPASAYGQCVTDRFAVDACLGGVRISGSSGPPGLTFDQSFLTGSLGTGAVFTRASTGMYCNSAGTLVSAAINTPRFDYDPQTLQLKGLLLEDASTNLALQSGNLANAAWALGSAVVGLPVVTANQVNAPDGTLTAARIVFPAITGASAFCVVAQNITGAFSTGSVWLRGNVGGEQLYLNINGSPTYYTTPRITLTTQWQRYSVTAASAAPSGWWFNIGADLKDTNQTSTPAQTIYAWGAQVEALPYMSSYIPTTSVSVTRAQDVLTYPAASMTWFTSPGGSWFADFIQISGPGNNRIIAEGILGLQKGMLTGNGSRQLGQYDGATPMSTANSITPGAVSRGVSSWLSNAGKVCLNSGTVANAAMPAGGYASLATNGIRVFCDGSGGNYTTGWIRRISYWPRTLSDSEMQAVTTLAGPTLSLDFMQPGTLDPRITFTRASTAAYIDASGFIQMAAVNAPRWDYDPVTHASRGVLIEEQRTNLLTNSGDASNATTWARTGVGGAAAPTVTGNQIASPDGATTGAFVSYPAVSVASTASYILDFLVNGTTNPYSFSVWLRGAVGGEQIYLFSTQGGVTYYRSLCTLTTSWQRFTTTTPNLTAAPWYFGIGTDLRDGSQTPKPAQAVYAWGGQIEQGAFPTSYIPTTSVAVTRAADVASMPTNVSWFSQTTGTLAYSMQWKGGRNFPNPIAFVGANPNTDGHAIRTDGVTGQSIHYGVTSSGTDYVTPDFSGAPPATASPVKSAFAYSASRASATVAGAPPVSVAVTGPLPVIQSLFIGQSVLFQLPSNLWAQHIDYWNRTLSDAEMQQVTT